MNSVATIVALATLRGWAQQAKGSAVSTLLPPAQAELVQQAAWLLQDTTSDGWATPPAGPLRSVFCRVAPPQQPDLFVRRGSLPLPADQLFPCHDPEAALVSSADPELALLAELGDLDQRHLAPAVALEGILAALQRHAWSLPSPLDAVSLYAFAHSHAAIAAALAAQDDPQGNFFLLGLALNRITDFIVPPTSAATLAQLHGRSFYAHILILACARALLRAAALPLSNLLYVGGGHCYLLLPGQVAGMATSAWLVSQCRRFDQCFFQQYQGDLALALGGAEIAQADLGVAQRFQASWARVSAALDAALARPFAHLGADLGQLFAVADQPSEAIICPVCHHAHFAESAETDATGTSLCRSCASFEALGQSLHTAHYLLLHHLEQPAAAPEPGPQPWQHGLAQFGLVAQLLQPDSAAQMPLPGAAIGWTTLLPLHESITTQPATSLLAQLGSNRPWLHGCWPSSSALVSAVDQPPPTIASLAAQSRGIKGLGTLRASLEGLDDLICNRLDGGLAHAVALGNALERFSTSRVATLCAQHSNQEPTGSVSRIFSSGSDILIIGSWHLLPTLARQINDDLSSYTGNHPALCLAAGITLNYAECSLYEALAAAATELQRARWHVGRAALGWLDQAIDWAYVAPLFALVAELDSYLQAPNILPTPTLHTLYQLYTQYLQGMEEHQRQQQPGQFFYGPWIWRGVYQLKRLAERTTRHKAARSFLDRLRNSLLEGLALPAHSGGRMIEQIGLATRWVQLLNQEEPRAWPR